MFFVKSVAEMFECSGEHSAVKISQVMGAGGFMTVIDSIR